MCPRCVIRVVATFSDLSTRSSNEKTWKRARRQVERSTRATTDADRGPDGFVFKTVSSQTRNFRCDHACRDGGVARVRTSAGRAASGSPRLERPTGCRAAGLYRSAAGARIQDWAGAALRPACPHLRGDGDITAVAVPGMIPARLAGSCPMLPGRRWPLGAARSIGAQQGWLYGTSSFRLAFSAHVLCGLIRRAGDRFQFHMDATKMKRGPERRRGVGVQHAPFMPAGGERACASTTCRAVVSSSGCRHGPSRNSGKR
jgi:hypothetical protein